eukprot:XP_014789997.1 PREDICTED: uncharacterized protein LOC106883485 [Octopus bimaculoides]
MDLRTASYVSVGNRFKSQKCWQQEEVRTMLLAWKLAEGAPLNTLIADSLETFGFHRIYPVSPSRGGLRNNMMHKGEQLHTEFEIIVNRALDDSIGGTTISHDIGIKASFPSDNIINIHHLLKTDRKYCTEFQ